MKKMYEKTVWGYYVMSVVLGILLALSVALALEVAVMGAVPGASLEMLDMLDEAWTYLPLGVTDVFYGTRWQEVLMVTVAIMTVGIFVRMAGTGKSRTKILQAVAVALLALLMMLAYRYAFHCWIPNGALALVPVLLMVIPLTILRNTQQKFEAGALAMRVRGACGAVRRFASEHKRATGIIIIVAIFALYIAASVIVHYFFG